MHTTLKLYIKVQAILLVNNENIFSYKSTKEKIGFIAFTARQVLDDIPETSQFLPCQSHFSPRIIHSMGLLNTGEQIRGFLKVKTKEDLCIIAVEKNAGFLKSQIL